MAYLLPPYSIKCQGALPLTHASHLVEPKTTVVHKLHSPHDVQGSLHNVVEVVWDKVLTATRSCTRTGHVSPRSGVRRPNQLGENPCTSMHWPPSLDSQSPTSNPLQRKHLNLALSVHQCRAAEHVAYSRYGTLWHRMFAVVLIGNTLHILRHKFLLPSSWPLARQPHVPPSQTPHLPTSNLNLPPDFWAVMMSLVTHN
jgi:hypothetical protein